MEEQTGLPFARLRRAVRRGLAVDVRDELGALEAQGLLTRELLTSLKPDATSPGVARLLADRSQALPQERPTVVGTVWIPVVSHAAGSPEDYRPTMPLRLTCRVSSLATFLDAANADAWRAGLERLVGTVGHAVVAAIPLADARWYSARVHFDVESPDRLSDQDRSFELAAAIALLSSAFAHSISSGTSGMALVDSSGAIVPLGSEEAVRVKCLGVASAVGVVDTVFVASDELTLVEQMLEQLSRDGALQHRVAVIGVSSLKELFDAMGLDVAQFRGLRRRPRTTVVLDTLIVGLTLGLGPVSAFRARWINSDLKFGRLYGEQVGVSAMLVAGASAQLLELVGSGSWLVRLVTAVWLFVLPYSAYVMGARTEFGQNFLRRLIARDLFGPRIVEVASLGDPKFQSRQRHQRILKSVDALASGVLLGFSLSAWWMLVTSKLLSVPASMVAWILVFGGYARLSIREPDRSNWLSLRAFGEGFCDGFFVSGALLGTMLAGPWTSGLAYCCGMALVTLAWQLGEYDADGLYVVGLARRWIGLGLWLVCWIVARAELWQFLEWGPAGGLFPTAQSLLSPLDSFLADSPRSAALLVWIIAAGSISLLVWLAAFANVVRKPHFTKRSRYW